MDLQVVFWSLITLTAVELLAIYILGNSIRSMLASDYFRKKMEKVNAREKAKAEETAGNEKGNGMIPPMMALLALSIPALAFGMDTAEAGPLSIGITEDVLYAIGAFNVLLLGVLFYLRNLFISLVNIDKTEAELQAELAEAKGVDIMHILTDAVPLEQEELVETDHEYDGIRELDNNLPPWWKYGFYLSIVIAVVYLFHFHVLQTGDLQIAAYNSEIRQADADIQAYLEAQAMNVDENSVTLMAAAGDLNVGKEIFMQYCKVCHGEYGEGLVGPNFTDEYWIHGGRINDLFRTIKYGAENGMKSWKDELNPIQMQQVASYIKTLGGTNPDNQKGPEGELYVEEAEAPQAAATDSTQTDSITIN